MFENEFNLSFNLHKAYTDIGIKDDDKMKMSCIYDIPVEKIDSVLEGFALQNQDNAQQIRKEHPDFSVDSEKEMRIAYLGDSITSYRMSHQRIVEQILKPYSNIKIKDFSISGLKISDLFTAFYPGIYDFKPNIAVMMIGTNDMRITNDEYGYTHTPIEHYVRDLNYLVQKLNKIDCKVILVTLPPFCMEKMDKALLGWEILYRDNVQKVYDDAIVKAAKENNAILVDMRDEYKKYNAADITIEDGLHLNPEGQTILAANIFLQMKQLLK